MFRDFVVLLLHKFEYNWHSIALLCKIFSLIGSKSIREFIQFSRWMPENRSNSSQHSHPWCEFNDAQNIQTEFTIGVSIRNRIAWDYQRPKCAYLNRVLDKCSVSIPNKMKPMPKRYKYSKLLCLLVILLIVSCECIRDIALNELKKRELNFNNVIQLQKIILGIPFDWSGLTSLKRSDNKVSDTILCIWPANQAIDNSSNDHKSPILKRTSTQNWFWTNT